MYRLYIILFCFFISFQGFAQPSNDDFSGAINIDALLNNCSPNAVYTTSNATFDNQMPSCGIGGSYNNNVWFQFTAPVSGRVSLQVKRGGAFGNLQRILLGIWENDGTTEVACNRYVSNNDNVTVDALGLTPGETYYLSVDNNNGWAAGSFTLCFYDTPSYDFQEGAIDISSLIGGCSLNAEYSTIGGTANGNAPACGNVNPNFNRWFIFQAPSENISIQVRRGGAFGNIQRINAAIFESDGSTEIACNRYVNPTDDVFIEANSLTIGNWYYLTIDNDGAFARGSFTLCVSEELTYDFFEGAISVDHFINDCSANAAFTTIGATAQGASPACWVQPNSYNRWFKFEATTSQIAVEARIEGAQGSAQNLKLAIWEADGATEVACTYYEVGNQNLRLETPNLVEGATYYILVDNHQPWGRGTFTLCLSDAVSYDFFEGAIDVTNLINSCSPSEAFTTLDGTPDLNAGSCWIANPNYNKWFRFQATTPSISIEVKRGAGFGTIRRIHSALWEADGSTELACAIYPNEMNDVTLDYIGLTVGEWYYFSVDNDQSWARGTFTICLNDGVSNDFFEGAITLNDITNWCSAPGEFTTVGGTPDRSAGSCWPNGPNFNKWFRFQATTEYISVLVDRDGNSAGLGNIRQTLIALWDDDGVTEVACNRYVTDNTEALTLSSVSLTPGNWYYISVDSQNGWATGNFTLCVNNQPDYDFYEGAFQINNTNNWCSGNAQFTTTQATQDLNAGSCWNASPNYNRWFKFQAVFNEVNIQVNRGGAFGTASRLNVALWEADGVTEVACNRYGSSFNDNVTITNANLIPGNTYYISVDVSSQWARGSFTLCVDNSGEQYYSINSGSWTDGNNWSLVGHNGVPAGSYPQTGDIANIAGHTISLIDDISLLAGLNINVQDANTALILSGANLEIVGDLIFENQGNDFSGSIVLNGNSNLNISSNFRLNRLGGNQVFSLNISDDASMLVNNDFIVNSESGSTHNNIINLENNAQLVVNRDFYFNRNSGPKSLLLLQNNTSVNIGRDVNFNVNLANTAEIQLQDLTTFRLSRSFNRSGNGFGILNAAPTSFFEYVSSLHLQNFAGTLSTAGGDTFNYGNVVINNTRITIPQVTLQGEANILGNLTFNNGVLSLGAGQMTVGGNLINNATNPLRGSNQAVLLVQGNGTKNLAMDLSSPGVTNRLNTLNLSGSEGSLILQSDVIIDNTLNIPSGASIQLQNHKLTLVGSVMGDGNFTGGSSAKLHFRGSVSNAGTFRLNQASEETRTLDSLIIEKSAGAISLTDECRIRTALSVRSGTFNTGNQLILLATTNDINARIDEVGGQINGNVNQQKRFSLGANQWIELGSPVNTTLQDWMNSGMIFTGFEGSQWPNFPTNNAYRYNTSLITSQLSEGWGDINTNDNTNATNITNPVLRGQAWKVFTATNSYLLNQWGEPISDNFTLNLIHNTAAGANQSWNFISNPFCSPINWRNVNRNRVSPVYSVYVQTAPNTYQYATYEIGGFNTMGRDQYIPTSQGFWVRTVAPNPSLTFPQSAKVPCLCSLVRDETEDDIPEASFLKLKIENTNTSLFDETILVLNEFAQIGVDSLDAPKQFSDQGLAPHLSVFADTTQMVFNYIPNIEKGFIEVPLGVKIAQQQEYNFTLPQQNNFNIPNLCMFFVDKEMDIYLSLDENFSYLVNLEAGDYNERFYLSLGFGYQVNYFEETCYQQQDALLELFTQIPGNSLQLWVNGNLYEEVIEDAYYISAAEAGNYAVLLNESSVCYNHEVAQFELQEAPLLMAEFSTPSYFIELTEAEIEVYFTNNSIGASQFVWTVNEGGNEIVFNTENLSYNFAQSGVHAINLKAFNDNGDCVSEIEKEITIYITTDISDLSKVESEGIKLLTTNNAYTISFEFDFDSNAIIQLIAADGKKVLEKECNALKGEVLILERNKFAKGAYFLNVIATQSQRNTTLKLIF